MSDPLIRKARSGDEPAIHEAHMRSIREVCVKDHGEDEVRGWGYRPLGNRWVDFIKQGCVWVVELDGVVQGMACVTPIEKDGEKIAYIKSLYLTPDVLGKGVGKKMAQIMLDAARGFGVKKVELESTITAHEFYRSLGFVDSGPMNRRPIGGHPVTCFPMTLHLSIT